MRTYCVFNRSKDTVVAAEVELAETAWSRLKGLLGRSEKEFAPGKGLWIYPSQGVHTFGMSYPIDVIYLDSAERVIRVCHRLAPSRIGPLKLRARSVIELPAGTLAQSRTSAGDALEIRRVETVEAEPGVMCAAAG